MSERDICPEGLWKFLVALNYTRYDRAPSMTQVEKNNQDAIIWADNEIDRLRAAHGALIKTLRDQMDASPMGCQCAACVNSRAAIAKAEGK